MPHDIRFFRVQNPDNYSLPKRFPVHLPDFKEIKLKVAFVFKNNITRYEVQLKPLSSKILEVKSNFTPVYTNIKNFIKGFNHINANKSIYLREAYLNNNVLKIKLYFNSDLLNNSKSEVSNQLSKKFNGYSNSDYKLKSYISGVLPKNVECKGSPHQLPEKVEFKGSNHELPGKAYIRALDSNIFSPDYRPDNPDLEVWVNHGLDKGKGVAPDQRVNELPEKLGYDKESRERSIRDILPELEELLNPLAEGSITQAEVFRSNFNLCRKVDQGIHYNSTIEDERMLFTAKTNRIVTGRVNYDKVPLDTDFLARSLTLLRTKADFKELRDLYTLPNSHIKDQLLGILTDIRINRPDVFISHPVATTGRYLDQPIDNRFILSIEYLKRNFTGGRPKFEFHLPLLEKFIGARYKFLEKQLEDIYILDYPEEPDISKYKYHTDYLADHLKYEYGKGNRQIKAISTISLKSSDFHSMIFFNVRNCRPDVFRNMNMVTNYSDEAISYLIDTIGCLHLNFFNDVGEVKKPARANKSNMEKFFNKYKNIPPL